MNPKYLLSTKRQDNILTSTVTATFFVLGALIISHHEMWRDEIQAWLIARDSDSVINLLENIKYEGHPSLWFMLLMPLTHISRAPTLMQGFHLLVATLSIFLFVRYSPFTRPQKILYAFGYFSFYEYSIVSRNYAVGVLLIFIFCSLFKIRYNNLILISLVLFLLSHTSALGTIVAVVLCVALVIDIINSRCHFNNAEKQFTYKIPLSILIMLIGISTSVAQMIPPSDSGFATEWNLTISLGYLRKVLDIIPDAYFPIPSVDLHFWNSNALASYPRMQEVLAGCFVSFAMIGLIRRPIALFVFLGCSLGLLAFFYVKYFGCARHHGFLFISLIMSAWIYHHSNEVGWLNLPDALKIKWDNAFSCSLTFLLAAHVIGSIIASVMDYRYEFSSAKSAANYIKSHNLEDALTVGYTDYTTSTIIGYLGKDRIYYPQGNRFGSYIKWDNRRNDAISMQEIVNISKELSGSHNKGVLLILNTPLDQQIIASSNISYLASFTESIVSDEVFYIYHLN